MMSPAGIASPTGETSEWDRDAALTTARLLLEIKQSISALKTLTP